MFLGNKETYPLTGLQREYFQCWKREPKNSELILSLVTPIPYYTDISWFVKIHDELCADSPVLHTRFVETEDSVRQYCDTSMEIKCEVLNLTDEEMDSYKDQAQQYFDFLKGPLVKNAVIITPTRKFFNICAAHILFDGAGLQIFANDLFHTVYLKKPFSKKGDVTFYEHLKDIEKLKLSLRFQKDKEWWKNHLQGISNITDFAIVESCQEGNRILKKVSMPRTVILDACKKKQITVNEMLTTAWALALSATCKMKGKPYDNVTFTSLKRGRKKEQRDSYGNFLFESILRLDEITSRTPMENLLAVRSELLSTNRRYLFTRQDCRDAFGFNEQGTTVIYDGDMESVDLNGQKTVAEWTKLQTTTEFLNGILWSRHENFEMEFFYSEILYQEEDVNAFIDFFEKSVKEIIGL